MEFLWEVALGLLGPQLPSFPVILHPVLLCSLCTV